MSADDDRWATKFPPLFRRAHIEYASCDVGFTTEPVPDPLVSRLHLIALTAEGKVIVCRSSTGDRFLPGGTREIGESLEELANRELMEEAGAHVTRHVVCFGAHIADSRRDRPHRPHLPHPRVYWQYGVVTAEIVTDPTNPADGETVIEVQALTPEAAISYLQNEEPLHADVLRLALAMDLINPVTRAASDRAR